MKSVFKYHIRKTFKTCNQAFPLELKFFIDEYEDLYRTEQKMRRILGYFSFLAIIISCLGLLGLSSFMTERRTKEIGFALTASIALFIALLTVSFQSFKTARKNSVEALRYE